MNKYNCVVVGSGLYLPLEPALQLRARVYCKEKAWLVCDDDIEVEQDVDYHSLHMFMTTKEDPTVAIANLRLTPKEFSPMQLVAPIASEGDWEIGRLCIDPAYRGRETSTILIHLFGMLYQVSVAQHIRGWSALMSADVLNLLAHYGINFDHVYDPVEYHGPRVPVSGSVASISAGVAHIRPDVWAALHKVEYTRDGD